MISAEELYRRIKEKYPDFRPPKAETDDFSVHPTGPFDEDQIKLMEMGFPIKPKYDPRFYKDKRMDPKEVDRVIEECNKLEPDPAALLYGQPPDRERTGN